MRNDCVHSFGHSFVSQIFWRSAVRTVVASPPFLRSSEECCPLPETFLRSNCAQPLQSFPSAQVGFQPLVLLWSRLVCGWTSPLQYSLHCFGTAVLSNRMFPLLSWVLVRAFRVVWASLLFPDIIPFSMFLHCSSIHSSFAAFIFFLTSLFTFLYSSPASVLVYFCCFNCRFWSHRSRTSFVTHGLTSSFFSQGPLQLLRVALLLDCSQGVYIAVKNAVDCKFSTYLSLEHFRCFGSSSSPS